MALDGAWPSHRLLVARLLLALGQCAVLLLLAYAAGRLGATLTQGPSVTLDLGLLAALLVLSTLLVIAQAGVSTHAKLTAQKHLQRVLFEHLQKAELRDTLEHPAGDLINRLTQDVDTLVSFTTAAVPSIGPQALMTLGALVLMFAIDGALAVASMAAVAGLLILVRLAARSLRPLAMAQAQAQSESIEAARALLAYLPVSKAFGREEAAISQFSDALEQAEYTSRRLAIYSQSLQPAAWLLAGLGLLVLLVASNRGWVGGGQDPQLALSLVAYTLVLARGTGAMAAFYGTLQQALAAATRIAGLRQMSLEQEGTTPLPAGPLQVRFRSVDFAYPGQRMLLTNIDLTLEPGTITALTGANGTGKSTLAALLLRFERPSAGSVSLGGHDVQTLTTQALRQAVAWVPQHPQLLPGTIATNIGWSNTKVSRSGIEAAARLATAHAFINALPHGYDTLIGAGNVPLSGGQMQRIAIARAVFANAPILLLDEATSMFAPEDDEHLFDALKNWLQTRAVLIITHRATTLARAGQVLHLHEGTLKVQCR